MGYGNGETLIWNHQMKFTIGEKKRTAKWIFFSFLHFLCLLLLAVLFYISFINVYGRNRHSQQPTELTNDDETDEMMMMMLTDEKISKREKRIQYKYHM